MRRIFAQIVYIVGLLVIGFLLLAVADSGPLTSFWSHMAHEVGFALIVAVAVWVLFEVRLSQETEDMWTRRIEGMSQNVFQAVLKRDLPKELLDEAQTLIWDQSLVRDSCAVEYTLNDHQVSAGQGRMTDCVLMNSMMTFTVRNVSRQPQRVPLRLMLPNPVHPELKKLTRVASFEVRKGGQQLELDDTFAQAERCFRAELNRDHKTSIAFDMGIIELSQGESFDFKAEYVMAKEVEDSELLQTMLPCRTMSVTITDRGTPGGRLIYARSVHRRDIEATSPKLRPETKNLLITEYLLPHQGVLVWWKRSPPAPAAARQAAAVGAENGVAIPS